MNEHLRESFNQYMRSVASTASQHCLQPGGLYYGPEGAKRLGRECGPAMLDFGKFGENSIGATYSGIWVIAYRLRPPINASTWLDAVREGMEAARKVERVPIPKNYTPAPLKLDGSPDTYKALWRGADGTQARLMHTMPDFYCADGERKMR